MKKMILSMAIAALIVMTIGCSGDVEKVEETNDNPNIIVVPDRKAEVFGVVKNIVGNEITISLLSKENQPQGDGSIDGIELTDEEKADKQAANRAARESGEKSGGGMAEVELSGETADYIIPVGSRVIQSSGIGELVAVNIGDIYSGMSVKIWLLNGGEGDSNLTEFVQIITR